MDHKILCIDDETHNLEALERLLRKKYKTICVASGQEGLEELQKNDFSLIISDQKMPEMTGVEFFMKAKNIQPEAIRILLTGYTDLESVIDAINQGQIYRYITKPWDPDELIGTARQAIEVFEMKGLIEKQNRELQIANEQLQSLDKLKTDFMLLVNHELKTPLTGIFSFVQLLKEENLSEEQSLYVKKISKNTKRLEDLINDTLLITRLKANTELNQSDDCAIDEIIKQNWEALEKEYANKQLQLSVEGVLPFSQRVNRKYIDIVVKKLLHNCFSHAKIDSSVTIYLQQSQQDWALTIVNEASQEITADISQLTSAFSTSKPILNHSGGTGLGLAIIQTIVNLFSGNISLNTENKTFKIELNFPLSI